MQKMIICGFFAAAICNINMATGTEKSDKNSHETRLPNDRPDEPGRNPTAGQPTREGVFMKRQQSEVNFLWIVELDQKFLDDHGRALLGRLRQSKIPTPLDARTTAIRQGYARLAQDRPQVVSLVQLGRRIDGFADGGDLVWVVRIIRLGGTRGQPMEGVVQELWISSTTGQVKSVLPPE